MNATINGMKDNPSLAAPPTCRKGGSTEESVWSQLLSLYVSLNKSEQTVNSLQITHSFFMLWT